MTRLARRSWLCTLAIALCALHVWMAASVSRTFSTTFDEIAHLTAGYTYWTHEDYRFQPENGNFPQRFAALPLLTQNVTFPPASGEDWRAANVWRIGHAFFHENGNNLPSMLAAGRAMNALLSGTLCFVIFLWSRQLFGPCGAFLALLLAVFCPSLLANGGLITSDTAAALGLTVATLAWWRLLHRQTLTRLLAAGLGAGLLAISKYSVVLFAPMAVLMLGIRLMRPAPLVFIFQTHRWRITGWRRIPALGFTSLVATGLCITVIWSAYSFRYSAAPRGQENHLAMSQAWDEVLLKNMPPSIATGSDIVDLRPGAVQAFVTSARTYQLLPEAWLYGLAYVEKNARGRLAYFAGEYRLTGWRTFFPTVFLLKTTLPALALIILGVIGVLLTPSGLRRIWLYRIAPLLVLLAVYWAFSIHSTLNIGHRHILPIYPAFYILAGGSLLLLNHHRMWALVLIGLLVWHTHESRSIRPDYLAYFNSIAGGPERAHRLFVDSSLDWGQDLPRLKLWLDEHARNEPVFLSYFGTGSPKHTGIAATRIADANYDREPRPTVPALTGGVYCLSSTMFSRVYSSVRGPWSNRDEAAYQQLSAWLSHLRALPAGAPPTWFDGTVVDSSELSARLDHYEHLLFGRLCHFLQLRAPDARIGYSIRIFRLTDEEATLVQKAPLQVINTRLLQSQP